jgi:hypothetical protein
MLWYPYYHAAAQLYGYIRDGRSMVVRMSGFRKDNLHDDVETTSMSSQWCDRNEGKVHAIILVSSSSSSSSRLSIASLICWLA